MRREVLIELVFLRMLVGERKILELMIVFMIRLILLIIEMFFFKVIFCLFFFLFKKGLFVLLREFDWFRFLFDVDLFVSFLLILGFLIGIGGMVF